MGRENWALVAHSGGRPFHGVGRWVAVFVIHPIIHHPKTLWLSIAQVYFSVTVGQKSGHRLLMSSTQGLSQAVVKGLTGAAVSCEDSAGAGPTSKFTQWWFWAGLSSLAGGHHFLAMWASP